MILQSLVQPFMGTSFYFLLHTAVVCVLVRFFPHSANFPRTGPQLFSSLTPLDPVQLVPWSQAEWLNTAEGASGLIWIRPAGTLAVGTTPVLSPTMCATPSILWNSVQLTPQIRLRGGPPSLFSALSD